MSVDVETSVFPTVICLYGITSGMQDRFGIATDNIAFVFRDKKIEYWVKDNSYSVVGKYFLNMFISNRKFIEWVGEQHFRLFEDFRKLSKLIKSFDIKRCTNKSLFGIYSIFWDKTLELYTISCTLSSIELDIELISSRLREILKKKNINDDKKGYYFTLLTTPEKSTIYEEEKIHFLDMQLNYPDIKDRLKSYLGKYYWIQYGFEGKVMNSETSTRAIITGLSKNNGQELSKIIDNRKNLISKQKEAEKILKLNEEEKFLFYLSREVVCLKSIRKAITFFSACELRPVLCEMAARLNLTMGDLCYLLKDDLKTALLEGQNEYKNIIQARKEICIFARLDGRLVEFTGKEARDLLDKMQSSSNKQVQLKGTPAFCGKAKGRVKKILEEKDMPKFNEGDILVSYATNPNLVPIMGKAAAIITQEGGLTCHAAIFSREFSIPCIVGVKNVLDGLKDGDMVEVDAYKGEIKIIKND